MSSRSRTRVIVLGTGSFGRLAAERLRGHDRHRQLVGHLSFEGEATAEALPGEITGPIAGLERVLRERVVDEVYVATAAPEHSRAVQRAIDACERLGVSFALPSCPFEMRRARPVHTHAFRDGFLHLVNPPACRPLRLAVKRAVDVAAASLALLALSPLLLVAALAVKLTSRGPVLFRQPRVGLHGRTFSMLKFRSMVVDAEARLAALAARNEQTGPVFKMLRDPRVTAVGRFMRKHSIDELPQLVNVLLGDMSVVGPRPPLPREVAQYEGWQRRRLSVRPGLTCIWQVSGRNAIGFTDWMLLDLRYIDHWSLGRDLSLIAKTVPVVLTGRGAS